VVEQTTGKGKVSAIPPITPAGAERPPRRGSRGSAPRPLSTGSAVPCEQSLARGTLGTPSTEGSIHSWVAAALKDHRLDPISRSERTRGGVTHDYFWCDRKIYLCASTETRIARITPSARPSSSARLSAEPSSGPNQSIIASLPAETSRAGVGVHRLAFSLTCWDFEREWSMAAPRRHVDLATALACIARCWHSKHCTAAVFGELTVC
jgi:hypothetical protein